MGANVPEIERLTPRQLAAMAQLAMGASIAATARSCGAAPKTIRAWLRIPLFAAELRRLQAETLRSMAAQLVALGDLAAEAVKRGLDPGQPIGQQLRAAGIVYDKAPGLLDFADLAERMAALERRLDEQNTKYQAG